MVLDQQGLRHLWEGTACLRLAQAGPDGISRTGGAATKGLLEDTAPTPMDLQSGFNTDEAPTGPLEVVFFLSSDCNECARVRSQVIPRIKSQFGECIRVKTYEVGDLEIYETLKKYELACGSREETMLKMFVAKEYLAGEAKIVEQSSTLIEHVLFGDRGSGPGRS